MVSLISVSPGANRTTGSRTAKLWTPRSGM